MAVGFEPTTGMRPSVLQTDALTTQPHHHSILDGIRTRDLRRERAAATPQTHEDNFAHQSPRRDSNTFATTLLTPHLAIPFTARPVLTSSSTSAPVIRARLAIPFLVRRSVVPYTYLDRAGRRWFAGARKKLPRRRRVAREGLDQRLDEEVIAPRDRFVHAELLVVVIHRVHEDALPLRPLPRQELVAAQRLEDRQRRGVIASLFVRVAHRLPQIPQATRPDRAGGGVPQMRHVRGQVVVPVRHQPRRAAPQPEVGVAPRHAQELLVAAE